MTLPTLDPSRGPALLALAGPPAPDTLATMVACAGNLHRRVVTTTTGLRPGALLETEQDVARVVATARRVNAAIVIVAGATSPKVVRRLATVVRQPVLLARTRQPWTLVMAATDLRVVGNPVVATGAALAARGRARSLVVHNLAPGWGVPGAQDLARAGGARRVRRLVRLASRTMPPSVVAVSSAGTADRGIVATAAERGADVVVVGMRRPTQQMRTRCADRVLSSALANVVVVPLGVRSTRSAGTVRS